MRLSVALDRGILKIEKIDGHWTILSEKGDRLAGLFASPEDALNKVMEMDRPYGQWLWGYRKKKK